MGGSLRPRPPVRLHLSWIDEEHPDEHWSALFERAWPSYRRWFLREGKDSRPDLGTCRAQLARHMPEIVPIFERLVELTGADDLAARMLSLYRPTPYITGCSQAVWSGEGGPILVRNYDYHPSAFEGTFLRSAWSGTKTMAVSDCLWGVLDGVNEHGLVVSLAFGGRRDVGDGFGIPLILRYVLETCRTVTDGAEVLQRVPSHMSYNVSLLDAAGERLVVAVAPDRDTLVLREDIATNHQHEHEWTRYDRFTQSALRERRLAEMVRDGRLDAERFVGRFLRPPLYNTKYSRAFGTLYTSAYWPASRSARFLWPDHTVEQSIDDFEPRELEIRL